MEIPQTEAAESDGDFAIARKFPEVIELNVGGVHHTTTLSTLTKGGSHMLSVMFSGRHNITTDSQGRYFIDADGNLFRFILRYLRSGELPCPSVAQQVYREAKFFGLEEFQRHIETMPVMMGRLARVQFQEGLSGFDDNIDRILQVANRKQCIVSEEVASYCLITILREPQNIPNKLFDNNHRCFTIMPMKQYHYADVAIGPWNSNPNYVTDRVYLRAVTRELAHRGFTVTFSRLGDCNYAIHDPDVIQCEKRIFKMLFHWMDPNS